MNRILIQSIILFFFLGCANDLPNNTIPPPQGKKEVKSTEKVIIATYKRAIVYAGATDYYFEDKEGNEIEFRISNVPDHKKEVIVPVDLLEPIQGLEGPPNANPLLVGESFKLIKDHTGKLRKISRYTPPNENQFVEEELIGVWLRKVGSRWQGLQFGKDKSLLTFPKARIYTWDLKNDKLVYSSYRPNRTSSQAIYTIESLSEDELIVSRGGDGKGSPAVFKRPEVKRETDEWYGKWTGSEGMVLEVYPDPLKSNNYSLRLHTSEGVKTYNGESTGNKIKFKRHGKSTFIQSGSGKVTEHKWLKDMDNCLYIKGGEAFCRDNI